MGKMLECLFQHIIWVLIVDLPHFDIPHNIVFAVKSFNSWQYFNCCQVFGFVAFDYSLEFLLIFVDSFRGSLPLLDLGRLLFSEEISSFERFLFNFFVVIELIVVAQWLVIVIVVGLLVIVVVIVVILLIIVVLLWTKAILIKIRWLLLIPLITTVRLITIIWLKSIVRLKSIVWLELVFGLITIVGFGLITIIILLNWRLAPDFIAIIIKQLVKPINVAGIIAYFLDTRNLITIIVVVIWELKPTIIVPSLCLFIPIHIATNICILPIT